MEPQRWKIIKELFSEALEREGEERVRFVSAIEPDLRAEVEGLLGSFEDAKDFIETPPVAALGNGQAESMAGQQIDDYRLISLIGAGGMGTVYLAEHAADGFSHRVALKLIKRGMDTGAVLKRFFRERQILAGLDHPNIARFLDGGSAQDGLPYFVMEYAEGLPIKQYCEENGLSTRERLELFRKVCSAVSFAHRNLVVHRDIKPSNIIVTEAGEPKLLDFGIAKLLQTNHEDGGEEATLTMFRALTPEYASPEQLQGKNVTTASDVYSLGVVLYELLTGRRPFNFEKGSPDDAVKKIITTEPPRPSSVVSGKPPAGPDTETVAPASTNPKALIGDLDNITLKALQLDPERRYASVEELSEDVRRHLAGLPVIATADTFAYRATKFIKRHQAGVFTAAVVGIILLLSTSFAIYQAYRAERERAKAEQRFADVRQLANSLVFDVNDALADVPGTLKAREIIVSRALEYLDKLAAESGDDPQLQFELAGAYEKVADVQNGMNTANIGDLDAAIASYRRTIELRKSIVEKDPSNVAYRIALGFGYVKLGNAEWQKTDVSASRASYERSVEVLEALDQEQPSDAKVVIELARATSFLVRVMAFQGDVEASIAKARANVQRVDDKGLDGKVEQAALERERARAYDVLGEILGTFTQNYEEVRDIFLKSLEITKRAAEREPEKLTGRRDLYVANLNLAEIYALLGDNSTALEYVRAAAEGFKSLSDADPSNDELLQTVAVAETMYGKTLIETGSPAQGVPILLTAVERLTRSAADSTEDDQTQYRLADARFWLSNAYIRSPPAASAANCAKARDSLSKSREVFSRFKNEGKLVGKEADRVEVADGLMSQCSRAIK